MGKGGQENIRRDLLSPRASKNCQLFPAWAKQVQECEEHYGVKKLCGLNSRDITKKREIYGFNELNKHEGPSFWALILGQFDDTLVRILLAAAIISFILAWCGTNGGNEGDEFTAFVEPLVIFLILIVNAIVGVWQETNTEKALEALKEIQSDHATVIREGKKIPYMPVKELVPGDIVELKVGEKVPADMRFLELLSVRNQTN